MNRRYLIYAIVAIIASWLGRSSDLFAQDDYNVKKAASYTREAEYYQKKAQGYYRLEDGDIEMDCEIFERNRSFIDCVGRGTPTNDRIRNFYSAQDSIIRECMAKGDEMVYSSYPEVEKHQIEYINRNKNDFSSVFLALDALRSGSSIEDIPDEIVNNKFVKAYIETCPKTEDTFSSIIEEEIIPIHVD